MVYFLKYFLCVYLCTKSQVSSKIQTCFRQGFSFILPLRKESLTSPLRIGLTSMQFITYSVYYLLVTLLRRNWIYLLSKTGVSCCKTQSSSTSSPFTSTPLTSYYCVYICIKQSNSTPRRTFILDGLTGLPASHDSEASVVCFS